MAYNLFVKIVVLCLYTAPLFFYSQNKKQVDSLKQELRQAKHDTTKIQLWNELAWVLKDYKKKDAVMFAKKALQKSKELDFDKGLFTSHLRLITILPSMEKTDAIALTKLENELLGYIKKTKNKEHKAKGFHQLGVYHWWLKNYKTSTEYYTQAMKIFKALGKPYYSQITNIILNYKDGKDYSKALKYALESLKELENKDDRTYYLANVYEHIGVLYMELKFYHKAKLYLSKALVIYKKLKTHTKAIHTYLFLAKTFRLSDDDTGALKYYQKVINTEDSLGINFKTGEAHLGMGHFFYNKDDYDRALVHYKKSLEHHSGSLIKKSLMSLNLGNIFYLQKKYPEALAYYREVASEDLDRKEDTLYSPLNKNLSLIFEKLGQYDSAYYYLHKYAVLSDSLSIDYQEAMAIQSKYEEEKKRLEKAKNENFKKTLIIYGLSIFVVLLLVIFYIIYKMNRQKEQNKRKNQEMQEQIRATELQSIDVMLKTQETERKRISKDLHDRLGSLLSTIKLFLKPVETYLNKIDNFSNTQFKRAYQLIDDACEETRNISYNLSSGVLMKFGLLAAIDDLVKTIQLSQSIKIDFISHGTFDRFENTLEINLYRIVQELVGNIIKHAHAKEINIQLICTEAFLNLTVEDDGKGFDINRVREKSMGLKNIKDRVTDLGGELNIDSYLGRGTTVMIELKF